MKPLANPTRDIRVRVTWLIVSSCLISLFDATRIAPASSQVAVRLGNLRVSDLIIVLTAIYIAVTWKTLRLNLNGETKFVFKALFGASCFSIIMGLILQATTYEIYSNSRGLLTLCVCSICIYDEKIFRPITYSSLFCAFYLLSLRLPIGVDFATILTVIAGLDFYYTSNSPKKALRTAMSYTLFIVAVITSLQVNQRAQVYFLLSALIAVVLLTRRRIFTGKFAISNNVTSASLFIGTLVFSSSFGLLLVPKIRTKVFDYFIYFISDSNKEVGNRLSVESRIQQWNLGIEAVRDSWIYGYGPGYSYTFKEPGEPLQVTYISHNIFLDATLRIGIPLTLFITFVIIRSLLACNLQSHGRKLKFTGAQVFFIAISAKGLVESVLDKPRIYVIYGICLGLSLQYKTVRETFENEYKKRKKP